MSGKSCGWSSGALAAMEPGARGALAGGEGEILGPVNLLRRIRESRVYVPLFGRRKLRSVIMAREQAELWKTRDNGGKAA